MPIKPPLGPLGGTVEAFIEVLRQGLIKYDKFLAKRPGWNPYALSLWLEAFSEVDRDVKSLYKKDDPESLAKLKKSLDRNFHVDVMAPVRNVIKQIDRWNDEGIYPSLSGKKKVKREMKTEALFGPKIPSAYQGRKVHGELPDKGPARQMAKQHGCDNIRVGLILQERPGFKPYWKVGWLGYQGNNPVGAVVEEYKGLGGPAKLDWVKGKGEPLGKAVKADMEHPRDKLAKFLLSNPNPPDAEFHKLAEQMGMSPHDLEEIAYKMLTEYIARDPVYSEGRVMLKARFKKHQRTA